MIGLELKLPKEDKCSKDLMEPKYGKEANYQ